MMRTSSLFWMDMDENANISHFFASFMNVHIYFKIIYNHHVLEKEN